MNDWLAHQARSSPNKTALIWGERSWAYIELDTVVSQLASQLREEVKQGTHVAVLMPNCPEFIFTIHALARLGAVLIPLNLRLTETELRWQVEHAECGVILCTEETEHQAQPLLARKPIPICVQGLTRDGENAHGVDGPPFDLRALQSIVFTSGTTGYPKGVMLSFANLFWSATASAYRLGILSDDRWLLCMPLYHVGGMSIVFRCCLYGTAVVLMEKFDVEQVRATLDRDCITLVSFVPTMLKRLLEVWQGNAPSILRAVLLGGAAASPELITHAQSQGWPLALTYGLTEACSQVTTSRPDETIRKPGSVGKPLMFSDLRIVTNSRQELSSEEHSCKIGEIVVRGPTVMQGYYQAQEASHAALQDGWLHTGDLGYLDEDGDLWVVDRRTDLIVTGGENVYPSEVERTLLTHAGVREACVVGIPDEEWGQRVVAVVVVRDPNLTTSQLTAFCRGSLSGYKTPREILFVASLPQTTSGKVKRQEVRKWVEDQTEKGYCP